MYYILDMSTWHIYVYTQFKEWWLTSLLTLTDD